MDKRPNRSDKIPKTSWAIWPIKKKPMIWAGAVEFGGSPKCLRKLAKAGSIISIPKAVSIIVQAESVINSAEVILLLVILRILN